MKKYLSPIIIGFFAAVLSLLLGFNRFDYMAYVVSIAIVIAVNIIIYQIKKKP